jgi:hypothetical protein
MIMSRRIKLARHVERNGKDEYVYWLEKLKERYHWKTKK